MKEKSFIFNFEIKQNNGNNEIDRIANKKQAFEKESEEVNTYLLPPP